jgi:hypothetical protein
LLQGKPLSKRVDFFVKLAVACRPL